MKSALLLSTMLLLPLCSSCASDPVVPSRPSQPVELAPLSPPALEIDWQEKMQLFLRGMLPELPF